MTLRSPSSSTGPLSNVALTNSTATTQGPTDNSQLIATDAFVNQQIITGTATVPIATTGGLYNQASLGSGLEIVIFASGGVVSSVLTLVAGGTGYANGDILVLPGGNSDAIVRVTNAVSGVVQSGGVQIAYGGTGYTTGAQFTAHDIPPAQRAVILSGVLTSNLTFIVQNGTYLTASRKFIFANNTTGTFTVTVNLSNGAGGTTGVGVVIPQGVNNSAIKLLYTDGVNDVWTV
jgi:hypothetical protein